MAKITTRATPAFAPELRPLEAASATAVAEAELEDVASAFAADEIDEEAIVEDAAADEVTTANDDVTSDDDDEEEDRVLAVDFAVGDKVLVILAEDVDVVLVLAVGDGCLAFAVVVLSSSSVFAAVDLAVFAEVVGLAPRVTKPAVGPEKVADAVT